MTSSQSNRTWRGFGGSPASRRRISSNSSSAPRRPSSARGCRTDDSGTAAPAANSMSSYPTTAMSSGTRSPWAVEPGQDPESDQVVGGEDGRGALGVREGDQLLGRRTAGRRGQRRGRDGEQHRPVAGLHGLLRPLAPVAHLPQRRGPADERDPPVAALQQVRHGQRPAGHVVDADAGEVAALGVAVEEHDRDPAPAQGLQRWQVVSGGGDQHAAHALLVEQLEVAPLPPVVARAVAEQDHTTGLLDGVLDPAGHVGEEGVGRVDDHEPHGAARAGPQLPGRLVADEPEVGDGGVHPVAGALGDQVGLVQHVGDGAHRHPGRRRDLLDAHRRGQGALLRRVTYGGDDGS